MEEYLNSKAFKLLQKYFLCQCVKGANTAKRGANYDIAPLWIKYLL
jgi:hypothetical protein